MPNLPRLIVAVLLLLAGLGMALAGVVVLVKYAKLNVQSTAGLMASGLVVTGLLDIAVAGSVWRSGGGGQMGPSRLSRRVNGLTD